jgi:signal transduction histidine kinase
METKQDYGSWLYRAGLGEFGMPKAPSKPPRSFTIRAALTRLLLVAAVPVWLATAVLLCKLQLDARASIERDASATARALMVAVDRDLASAQMAAFVLSTSSELSVGDFRGFQRRAAEALRANIAGNVLLMDRSGREVVNALVPYGEALPAWNDLDAVRTVFASGKPTISNLHLGAVDHRPVINAYQPVSIDNVVVYALAVGLKPGRLNEILQHEQFPLGWTASILDSQGVVVAATSTSKSTGDKDAADFLHKIEDRDLGVVEPRTLENTQVASVFARSPASGWTVLISVPNLELALELWKSAGISFAVTIVLVVLGFIGAHVQARRLAKPIQALESLATAYGHGEEIDPPRLSLKEANDVALALAEGSRQLRLRTKERDRANRQRRRIIIENELIAKQARTRSAYFAYLGHELGSPLMAIRAFADAISKSIRETTVSAKCLDYCMRIDTTTSHLIGIVDQILDYAKFEAHEIVLCPEKLQVEKEIADVLRILEGNAAQSGVAMEYQVASDPCFIVADRIRFRQILINIIYNSVKFTLPGGLVKITATTEGAEIVICVTDTGVGIDSKDLRRVLQPFAQASGVNTMQGAGTGLGLPFAKGLVELHAGTFKLESALGVGTTVTLRFPALECPREMLAELCSPRLS